MLFIKEHFEICCGKCYIEHLCNLRRAGPIKLGNTNVHQLLLSKLERDYTVLWVYAAALVVAADSDHRLCG